MARYIQNVPSAVSKSGGEAGQGCASQPTPTHCEPASQKVYASTNPSPSTPSTNSAFYSSLPARPSRRTAARSPQHTHTSYVLAVASSSSGAAAAAVADARSAPQACAQARYAPGRAPLHTPCRTRPRVFPASSALSSSSRTVLLTLCPVSPLPDAQGVDQGHPGELYAPSQCLWAVPRPLQLPLEGTRRRLVRFRTAGHR